MYYYLLKETKIHTFANSSRTALILSRLKMLTPAITNGTAARRQTG